MQYGEKILGHMAITLFTNFFDDFDELFEDTSGYDCLGFWGMVFLWWRNCNSCVTDFTW